MEIRSLHLIVVAEPNRPDARACQGQCRGAASPADPNDEHSRLAAAHAQTSGKYSSRLK